MIKTSPENSSKTRCFRQSIAHWFVADTQHEPATLQGPHGRVSHDAHRHPWYKVMCLSGVDYFSTLGYQPGIAALAAGALAPLATIVLILLTLLGALPIYRRVAKEAPLGTGSIGMLEKLLPRWGGKILVLILLGFCATDYLITMTLSASDATAHILENPYTPSIFTGHNVIITVSMLVLLTIVFLNGFGEAIRISVVLVVAFLTLNTVVLGAGFYQIIQQPEVVVAWQNLLISQHSNPLAMVAISLVVFPKLALGMSGFETGVVVMPQIKGGEGTRAERIAQRVRGVRKMLTVSALTMSAFLLCSSIVTTLLIPAAEFAEGGRANGRALAFIAHEYLGNSFGTIYDIATILILWFAGASAMAGLLNIVPRYLPRYGMAPEWAAHTRPLALVFGIIAMFVVWIFKADVDHQGAAYATGVLVLITSASFAVALVYWREHHKTKCFAASLVTVIFIYTTIVNIFERPEGAQIAAIFTVTIIVISFVSRFHRAYELRVQDIVFDEEARKVLKAAKRRNHLAIVAHEPHFFEDDEYTLKENVQRSISRIAENVPVVFLEVNVKDASDFDSLLEVHGRTRGKHRVLWVDAPGVPNAIAAILLYIRDVTGVVPDIYFEWTEANPTKSLLRFLFFGQGEVATVTHEVLRRAEADRSQRPTVHIG
ncbi:MAG: amino acid transporter [Lawsonella sp.]